MNYKPRPRGLIYGVISAVLCTGITIGGVRWAVSEAQEPELPIPTGPVHVLALPEAAEEPAISAADLWSDDRSRIDTPLLDVPLEAETQWAIFGQCGQDTKLFCTVMAIASVESGFDPQKIGSDGGSIGMMQINTRWHTGRMEALGVTDLTDPVQCAAVAIDYLLELETVMESEPGDHAILMAYNAGPDSAKRKIQSGTTASIYSTSVMEIYRKYITEMEE